METINLTNKADIRKAFDYVREKRHQAMADFKANKTRENKDRFMKLRARQIELQKML